MSLKTYLFAPLLGSLLLAGVALAGTGPKKPPPGYTYEYVTVGKHTERRLVHIRAHPAFYTMAVETGSKTPAEGDYWAMKTVGRRQVKVWVHDMEVYPGGSTYSGPCERCSNHQVGMGKHFERRDFCVVNGHEVDCSRNPAQCPDCAKAQAERDYHCEDEVKP